MRILHTGDWHAGRIWRGRRREDELAAVLTDLARKVEALDVDLVLVAGDLFDQRHPPAWAIDRVFACLRRIGDAGVPSVVVSGNHDSRERLAAWSRLTELVGVTTVTAPTPDGVVELETAAGEPVQVATAPFAPQRTLVSALELSRDEEAARRTWAGSLREILARQAERFRPDAVRLLVGHLAVDGARIGGSETRPLHGGEWTLAVADLPAGLQYAALGHVHRRQRLPGPVEAWYCGSPLQLDFSEVGQGKGCLLVDVAPGSAPRVEEIGLEGGRALLDVGPFDLDELEDRAGELRGAGWLRVHVRSGAPDPDLATRVRRLLPEAVVVRVEGPVARPDSLEPVRTGGGRGSRELYEEYCRRERGESPSPEVLAVFESLEREATGG